MRLGTGRGVEKTQSGEGAGPEQTKAANVVETGLLEARARAMILKRVLGVDVPAAAVGRFELRDALGSGAMGTVFSAWDPELEREVAVKVLRPDFGDTRGVVDFSREARAAAKFQHPHLLRVYEFGLADGTPYIVFERARCNLRQWLADSARTADEIIGVLAQAGRGLSAAHEKGLVHGDIKPDNILILDSGRAVVGDFGVSTWCGADLLDGSQASKPNRRVLAGGTIGYRYPDIIEDGEGVVLDRFAFAVTCCEALSGRRPNANDSAPLRGPDGRPVSRRLRAVLTDALRAPVATTSPGIEQIVALLEQRAPRRGRVVAAIGGALLVGLTAAAWTPVQKARCQADADRSLSNWRKGGAKVMEEALSGQVDSGVGDMLPGLSVATDEYAIRLGEVRRASCESSDRTRAAKIRTCAVEAERAIEDWARELRRADAVDRYAAPAALLSIPSPTDCLSANYADEFQDSSPELTALRRDIAAARLAIVFGRADEVDTGSLVRRAKTLRASHALARATFLHADSSSAAVGDDALISIHYAALAAASRAGSPDLVVQAWAAILTIRGDPGQPDAEYYRAEELALVAAENPAVTATRRAALSHARARFFFERGRYREAYALHEDAIAGFNESPGDVLARARAQQFYAQSLGFGGKLDEALVVSQASMSTRSQYLPVGHPELERGRVAHAELLVRAGDYTKAIEIFSQARERLRAVYGDVHPAVLATLYDADALARLGDFQKAIDHVERATEIAKSLSSASSGKREEYSRRILDLELKHASLLRRSGQVGSAIERLERLLEEFPDQPGMEPARISLLAKLGSALGDAGRSAEALAVQREVRSDYAKAEGPDSVHVGIAETNIANNLLRLGSHEEALVHFGLALTIFERRLGPEHPHIAHVLRGRARCWLALLDVARARKDADRALQMRSSMSPEDLTETLLVRLRVEAQSGHRTAALELLAEARDAASRSTTTGPATEISVVAAELGFER